MQYRVLLRSGEEEGEEEERGSEVQAHGRRLRYEKQSSERQGNGG